MKTKNQRSGLQSRPEHGNQSRNGAKPSPSQTDFGLLWQPSEHPFRLRMGDVIRYDGRLCRVVRVTECAAVVLMSCPVRDFKTRFDKPVRFTPPPKIFRISPNAEAEILNRHSL